MQSKYYLILIIAALFALIVACGSGSQPAPTPPVLKDVYATSQARLNEMQTEVSK